MNQLQYDFKTPENIESKPREKLIELGPDVLTNAELLANIFITGTRDEGVKDLSARCLKEYGSRSIANIRSVEKVQEVLGLTKVKACQLVSVFELARRFFKETNERMPVVRGPEDIFKLYKQMAGLKREELRAVYLNSRQRVVHEDLITIGKIDQIDTSVQIILQPAVELLAKSFILIHNHPSGNTKPSDEDILFSNKVLQASKLLDIELLDHVIIGKGYHSMRDEGEL